MVFAGQIRYFIGSGGGGFAGGATSSGTGSQISSWVEAHFTSTTVGGVAVYDLATPGGATTT
jgi:hypothetical protein